MKRISLAMIAAFILVSLPLPCLARSELFMMPYEQDKAYKTLLDSLKHAQKSIDIAIYSFTNRELAKALRDSARRGVKIRVIFDESNRKDPRSVIGYLDKYNNISVCLLKGEKAQNANYYGIMHQKLAIIDGARIYIGSANWSKNAFENSYETLFYDDDNYLIAKASRYYEKMLEKCQRF